MISLAPSMKSVSSVVINMKLVIKRILQVIAGIVAVTLVAFLILIVVLTVTEYKPDEIVELSVDGKAEQTVQSGDTLSVLTWNIGYGALGDSISRRKTLRLTMVTTYGVVHNAYWNRVQSEVVSDDLFL